MKVSEANLRAEVAVYKGEDILAEGTIEECAMKLKVKPTTIAFYLTPAYARKLALRTTLDKSRIVVRLDDDDE